MLLFHHGHHHPLLLPLSPPPRRRLPHFRWPTMSIIRPTSLLPFRRHLSVALDRGAIPWHDRILDPGSSVVIRWNQVFLLLSTLSLFVDPFYFFVLFVGGRGCLKVDVHIMVIVTLLRTMFDLCYLANLLLKFRIAFVAPSSRVFGRGELVTDKHQITMRYLKGSFAIDLISLLPIPQLIIWIVITAARNTSAKHTINMLSMIIFLQYLPRLYLLFRLMSRITKAYGDVTKTTWIGAAYHLILYMLASHGFGALWYLFSMVQQSSCWATECAKENGTMHMPLCKTSFLDCSTLDDPERKVWLKTTQVLSNCDATNSSNPFQFGMYADALTDDVVGATFWGKYLYCLWWGLRNLSSYGQNLATSTNPGETSYAIFICIVGLVLFCLLIGNFQTYLQSMNVRIEEWRVKRRDIEEWMKHRQLPQDLQERVLQFNQYKWLATRGVNEEFILDSLPLDLRRAIQRHLCLGLVRRVPFFSQMDDQLLDAICGCLVSSLSTKDTYIVREGDPVNEMLFIIRGQLESSTTNGGRSGFFNCITLGPGDFCGEELLTWALETKININLPSSTRTVRALSEVEGFVLRAEELKFVANQFKRLHSKKLQHVFKFYSHQWRTWGACFIQAAWRRHKKRKLAKELLAQENYYYMPSVDDENHEVYDDVPLLGEDFGQHGKDASPVGATNAPSQLGATILASKFAKNTKRGAQLKMERPEPAAISIKMPKLLKPDEPDFSSEQ
ncbi:cyclic nucleotide gated channel protein [Dioscorea alata]|uniref:Cyclic nucleotide gated channel protein n=1 Tax=Dioscorea alata TaxID=55571 RepID=A0ACB7W0H3_DIOAL|nr:cyclic nucleotide gated channel protein [Dioscorea alata]